MRFATRFPVAIHVLTILGMEFAPHPTSEYMAESIGVNPVMVRTVTGMLRRAGLVTSSQGKAGTHLAKRANAITMLDVLRAVETEEDLLRMHDHPNPNCPIEGNIESVVEGVFSELQRAMEERLNFTTLAGVIEQIRSRT